MRSETREIINSTELFDTIGSSFTPQLTGTAQPSQFEVKLKEPEPQFVVFDDTPFQRNGDQPPRTSAPPASQPDIIADYLDPTRRAPRPEQPARPEPRNREETHNLNWRGETITLKTVNGQSSYFKSSDGEWDSKDGETWVRRGSNGRDIWIGKISRDIQGNIVEEGTASGVTRVYGTDGSSTRKMKTESGQEISRREAADGTIEFSGLKKWTSTDGGNSWSDGAGNTWRGQIDINAYGVVNRTDSRTGVRDFPYRSKENATIIKKMEEISTRFNVSFGHAGTQYTYEYKDAATDTSKTVQTSLRMPSLQELNTLETALKKYSHTNMNGMRFNFINGSGDGSKVSEWGWYHSSKDGIPQIYLGPRNRIMSNGWEALEGTVLHEVAHHLQARRWTTNNGKEVPEDIMRFFGCEYSGSFNPNRYRDSDGNLWEHGTRRSKDTQGNWRYEDRWYPVVKGTVVKEEGRARTNQQMYESMPASSRPCTRYFTNASEAHAEALSMLLHDPKMLWERNANLYRAARQWDQTDINAKHGFQVDARNRRIVDADGKPVPKMIRGHDGTIVENNEANRNRVRTMESGWRTRTSDAGSSINWNEIGVRGGCPCCNA